MKKIISTLCLTTILANLAACGTVLYPERKGQKDGKIDAGVAVLNGIGLLFFIIPGVIAYAVDFATGAIYLPGGKTSAADFENNLANGKTEDMKVINLGKNNLTDENISKAIYAETGQKVSMNNQDAQVTRLR